MAISNPAGGQDYFTEYWQATGGPTNPRWWLTLPAVGWGIAAAFVCRPQQKIETKLPGPSVNAIKFCGFGLAVAGIILTLAFMNPPLFALIMSPNMVVSSAALVEGVKALGVVGTATALSASALISTTLLPAMARSFPAPERYKGADLGALALRAGFYSPL